MASTGLKIAIGVVIGVSLTGVLLSNVSPPSSASGQVNGTGPETNQQSVPAPHEAEEHEVVQADASDGGSPDGEQVTEAKQAVIYLIGLNGYDCTKIVNVQDASSGVYDVTCLTGRHGHEATYMVNSRTKDVAEL